MKNLLLFAFCILAGAAVAFADQISPTYNDIEVDDRNIRGITWEGLESGDTAEEAVWEGGKGYVEVSGTIDDADFEVKFGFSSGGTLSIDSDDAPDGLRFSSATGTGGVLFELPPGYIDIQFSSAGSNQDIDVRIAPVVTRTDEN